MFVNFLSKTSSTRLFFKNSIQKAFN